MMQTITLLLAFMPLFVSAQMTLDPETKKYTYQEVIEVNGKKDELYTKAKTWIVKAYKSANAVIQMDDRDSGTIIGMGVFDVKFQGGTRKVYHLIQIELKDGKYRYTITDFKLKFSDAYNEQEFEKLTNKDFWGLEKLHEATDLQVQSLITSLRTNMQLKSQDW